MADEVTANTSGPTSTVAQGKGKEKAPVVQDMSMDEEEDSSEGETGAEDEVSAFQIFQSFPLRGLYLAFANTFLACANRYQKNVREILSSVSLK